MSSKIYNYLYGIQTKGMYARREDKEKALSYAEKAKALQEEKEYWLDEIEEYVFPIGQPYDLHLVGKAKINP
jgi:hypothetical protein